MSATSFIPNPSLLSTQQCAHSVEFYAQDEVLLTGLSSYIGAALNAGDAAVTICTPEHHEGLERMLKAHGVDLDAAERQGRYIALDAAATLASFMRDGWPDGVLFNKVVSNVISKARAGAGSDSQVAAFGEMVAVLWAAGMQDAAIRLEALWNALARICDFRLRCAYPVEHFHDEKHAPQLLRICAEHSHVVPPADEQSSFGMWELDLNTDKCLLSAAAARLLGLPAGRCELGAVLQKMYYSGDREAFAHATRNAGTRNKSITLEFRVCDDDGSIRFLACQGRTFFNDRHPVLLGLLMDVTAHRSAIHDRLWLDDYRAS